MAGYLVDMEAFNPQPLIVFTYQFRRNTMGVLERLSTLIRANINDMLDSAEDPEIMLNQILRDMETEIGKARSQVADMMAQERLYSDDLKAEQDKVAHMDERAEYYVKQA